MQTCAGGQTARMRRSCLSSCSLTRSSRRAVRNTVPPTALARKLLRFAIQSLSLRTGCAPDHASPTSQDSDSKQSAACRPYFLQLGLALCWQWDRADTAVGPALILDSWTVVGGGVIGDSRKPRCRHWRKHSATVSCSLVVVADVASTFPVGCNLIFFCTVP